MGPSCGSNCDVIPDDMICSIAQEADLVEI